MLVARFIRRREFVLWRIGKSEAKDQLLGDEVKRAESPGELLEKSLQDEKERLGRFDFVLELDFFRKNLRWPDESQKTGRLAACLFPEAGRFRSEPGGEIILGESGKVAQGMDAPLVEDGDDAGNFRRPSQSGSGRVGFEMGGFFLRCFPPHRAKLRPK